MVTTQQWKMVVEILEMANVGHITQAEAEEMVIDPYFVCIERHCARTFPETFGSLLEDEIRALVRRVK